MNDNDRDWPHYSAEHGFRQQIGGIAGRLLNRQWLGLAVIGMVAGVGAIDWMTPPEFEVFALYVVVVIASAWIGGLKFGLFAAFLSLLSIIAQGVFQGTPYSTEGFFVVALANKIAILFILAVIVSRAHVSHVLALSAARTDPLTDLANRRHLLDRLTLEFHRSKRTGGPLILAYIDLDNFKEINDGYGHDEGDALLRQTADVISSCVRTTDLAARIGGDEFCILIADSTAEEGTAAANRLQAALRAAMRERNWPTTASIGVVTFKALPNDVADLLKWADRLMYEAKRRGKNQIAACTFPDDGLSLQD